MMPQAFTMTDLTSSQTVGSPFASRPSPLVSVVMSTFNDEDRVAEAVRSIQSQTLTDWELVTINDGSTDRTGDILDSLAEADSRIRVIHQENTGLTRALIRGCREARADFIARQDADDVSTPERLEKQLKLLRADCELGLVSCFAEYVGPENEYLTTVTRPADSSEATHALLNERAGPPAHGTVMFRKSVYNAVGGYRSEFYFGQDADLWLRLAERCKIAYVAEVGYRFRWHPGSITGSGRSVQRDYGILAQECRQARLCGHDESPHLEAAEQLRQRIIAERTRGKSSANRRANHGDMRYLIGTLLVSNRDHRARKYLWQVVRKRPWHWKAWVRLAQSLVSGEKREA